ncbi:hypothetical protein ACGFNU_21455 [Spirillospora sp. NPDC048911]|uniref:hypothetical protein n=1 Tax=Spirillospora sp. NPDC048911 TaxID=3364527 RepID=UPI0037129896
MKEIPLPEVTRVQEGRSSVVEPPLDTDWDEATKLAWQAAVVACDTGLPIRLYDGAWVVGGKPMSGYYSINVGPSSASSFTYSKAWTYLNGVRAGAEATKGLGASRAEAAIAEVRRLCNLTINVSYRAQAIDQAVDTLAVLDRFAKESS